MKCYKNKISFFLMSLFLSPTLYAVIVGSNESVSVQSHINFPAADHDNSILNFAFMKNGFSLQDASTTCTFDSVYPFLGALDLRGGTVILHQNFVLQGLIPFESSGTYIGNGNNVDYSNCELTSLADTSIDSIYQDVDVFLPKKTDFTLSHTLIFRGHCSLVGGAPSVTSLNSDAVLIVDSNSSLTIKNMILVGVHDHNVRCIDDTAQIIFDNTQVIQVGDYSFSTGSISFLNQVDWQGSFTFLYDSTQSSTIQSESVLHMFGGIIFSVGRSADMAVEPLTFTDQTSVLNLDNATLNITSYGAQFIKGTLETNGVVTIDVASTSTANALEFGDGVIVDDMTFEFNGGSLTNFNSGIVVWNLGSLQLVSQGSSATVAQGDASIFFIAQNMEVFNLVFDTAPLSQVILASSKTLLFNEVTASSTEGGSYIVTGFYEPGLGFSLKGNQTIDLVSGVLDVALQVSNMGNLLTGAGSINLPIFLSDSSAQLIWDLTGQLQTDLFLNGGALTLAYALNLAHHVLLRGAGTIHLDNFSLKVGDVSYDDPGFTWTSPLYWDGSIGSINMGSDVTLESVWTFSGEVWIAGNGYELDISNGSILIEEGSTLHFHNLNITGLLGTNISCLDSAGTIIAEGTTLTFDGDFTFTLGNLAFWDPSILQGNAIFAFQSDQPCTFNKTAQFTIDTGMTFSFDAASPDALQFDPAAQVILNGGNFFAGKDVDLIHGTLRVQPFGALSSASGATITLGDCSNPLNDFKLIIEGGAQLSVNQGVLNYKNLNASSLLMQNFLSNMFMFNDTVLNLYQTFDVGTGFITFGNSTLGKSPGKFLDGAVNEQGVLTFVTLPAC